MTEGREARSLHDLIAMEARWRKLGREYAEDALSKYQDYPTIQREFLAKGSLMVMCADDFAAWIARQPHLDPDLLGDVAGFLASVDWIDTTSQMDAGNLLERIREYERRSLGEAGSIPADVHTSLAPPVIPTAARPQEQTYHAECTDPDFPEWWERFGAALDFDNRVNSEMLALAAFATGRAREREAAAARRGGDDPPPPLSEALVQQLAADLHDLKERVLAEGWSSAPLNTPDYEAGVLDAAVIILDNLYGVTDEESQRRAGARLLKAIEAPGARRRGGGPHVDAQQGGVTVAYTDVPVVEEQDDAVVARGQPVTIPSTGSTAPTDKG